MPKAIWNGVTLAESSEGQVVEGNYYFPPQSIKREHLRSSMTHFPPFEHALPDFAVWRTNMMLSQTGQANAVPKSAVAVSDSLSKVANANFLRSVYTMTWERRCLKQSP
jgi:hypothetical protein